MKYNLKIPVAVQVFKMGQYLLATVFDHNGDVKLLVSSTATMALGKRAGDHDGLAEIGNIFFAKKSERQTTDLEHSHALRKVRVGTSMSVQGDKVFLNVLGKTVLAFSFSW